MRNIGSIVEGHGEVEALPIVLRSILNQAGAFNVRVLPPHRSSRNRVVAKGPAEGADLQRLVRFQGNRVGFGGLVVVLIDADDDDPDSVTSVLSGASAVTTASVLPVVATREYEAWFLAAIEQLRAHPDVEDHAEFPGDPEAPRDAKGEIGRRMNTAYKEVLHQPAFSQFVGLSPSERSPRFRLLVEGVNSWLDGNA